MGNYLIIYYYLLMTDNRKLSRSSVPKIRGSISELKRSSVTSNRSSIGGNSKKRNEKRISKLSSAPINKNISRSSTLQKDDKDTKSKSPENITSNDIDDNASKYFEGDNKISKSITMPVFQSSDAEKLNSPEKINDQKNLNLPEINPGNFSSSPSGNESSFFTGNDSDESDYM